MRYYFDQFEKLRNPVPDILGFKAVQKLLELCYLSLASPHALIVYNTLE